MNESPWRPPSPDSEERLDALVDSFLVQRQRGDRPSVEEFAARHPEHAEKIRELFPALAFLTAAGESCPAKQELDPSASLQTSAAQAPMRLGRYRILRELGRGGMGVVFEAEDERLGRRVAVKVLPFHSLMDRDRLERFLREARAAASLEHRHIIPIHAIDEENGIHYYCMRLVEGQGLDRVVEEVRRLRGVAGSSRSGECGLAGSTSTTSLALGLLRERFDLDGSVERSAAHVGENVDAVAPPLPILRDGWGRACQDDLPPRYFRNVARVARQAADALACAHSRGIVHRDVKPSNLLLDVRGDVWVSDFGLARDDREDGLTRSGDVVGTLRYLAPERLEGRTDPRSDIYSLGLTLYELVTLEPAFSEADRGALVRQVARGVPVAPRKRMPRVPKALEVIILKATARDPSDRYQTALELAEDLDRYLEARPLLARLPLPGHRLVRSLRRNPLKALGAGVMATVFAASFAWWLVPYPDLKPTDVLLRDLDGDGRVDIAVANGRTFEDSSPDSIALFRNRGGGTFQPAVEPSTGDFPLSLVAEDFDGDGLTDLAVSNQKSWSVSILDRRNAGAWARRTEIPLENYPLRIAACDVDRDRKPELATLVLKSSRVHLLRSRGDGTFERGTSHETGDGPEYVRTGDLDGDGIGDLMTANLLGKSVSVLLCDGKGGFHPSSHYAIGAIPGDLAIADLNGDGRADVAVTHLGTPGYSVLMNRGDGTLGAAVKHDSQRLVESLAAGDFDGDGRTELAGAGDLDYICWIPNEGDGEFGEPERIAQGRKPAVIRAADLDGDGDPDLAVTNEGFVLILWNGGKGRFEHPTKLRLPRPPFG